MHAKKQGEGNVRRVNWSRTLSVHGLSKRLPNHSKGPCSSPFGVELCLSTLEVAAVVVYLNVCYGWLGCMSSLGYRHFQSQHAVLAKGHLAPLSPVFSLHAVLCA